MIDFLYGVTYFKLYHIENKRKAPNFILGLPAIGKEAVDICQGIWYAVNVERNGVVHRG